MLLGCLNSANLRDFINVLLLLSLIGYYFFDHFDLLLANLLGYVFRHAHGHHLGLLVLFYVWDFVQVVEAPVINDTSLVEAVIFLHLLLMNLVLLLLLGRPLFKPDRV